MEVGLGIFGVLSNSFIGHYTTTTTEGTQGGKLAMIRIPLALGHLNSEPLNGYCNTVIV